MRRLFSIEITSTGEEPVTALAIGSVMDTLLGRVDPRLRNRRFRAPDYSFGFEAGSPKEISSVGESVLVNGVCYATSTEVGDSDYGKVIHGEEFVTGGMFLLPKGARPTHKLSLTSGLKFEELCQEIYRNVGRPTAFLGTWETETLSSIAIARPPINGLPIFENPDYYFPTPKQLLKQARCFVMGLITSYSDTQWESLNQQLEVALYKNPLDKQGSLSSHTHCLVLKEAVAKIEEVTPVIVQKCLHVFADQTTLKMAHLNLYMLDQVVQIE